MEERKMSECTEGSFFIGKAAYTNYDQLPLVLTVEQLAKVLGISRNTAYDIVRCGNIKSVRVGHKIRVPKEFLIDFLSNQ